MNSSKPKLATVTEFSALRGLASPRNQPTLDGPPTPSPEATPDLQVLVCRNSHANLDSLPLRFGVYLLADTPITLTNVKHLGDDLDKPNRIRVQAHFLLEGKEHFGYFILGRQRDGSWEVVTVWRNDVATEHELSSVMKALRKGGLLTSEQLRELYPRYRDGRLRTHVDLHLLLAEKMSESEIAAMRSATEEALSGAQRDIAQAQDQARQSEAKAVTLQTEKAAAEEKLAESERKRHELEQARAQMKGDTAVLSEPDTLMAVRENVTHRGSMCTILIMGDRSQRHMKIATFDRDGAVTARAKALIGRRVRVSGWDPVREPGKWSGQGYFRDIYAVGHAAPTRIPAPTTTHSDDIPF